MRTLFAFLLVVAFAATPAQAMDFDFDSIEYGLKGGINYGTFTDVTDGESLVGFTVGGTALYPVDDEWTLTVDGLFSQRGNKVSSVETKVTYIDVPVNLHYAATDEVTVFGGAYGSYRLAADSNGVDVKDAFRSYDLGIQFGAAYNYEGWQIGGQYAYGLIDLNGDAAKEVKNSTFTVSAAYLF